jgi:hypothetical protein
MPKPAIAPTYTVELEGKKIPLRFEHRDFAEAEGRLDIPLIGPASLKMWSRGTSAYQTGLLLFVGLLHAMPALTLDQARAFITFENAADIENTVTMAFQSALPQREENQAPAEVQPEASPLAGSDTGSCSGPSPSSTSDSQSALSGD